MRLHVVLVGVVDVIGGHQLDTRLPAHAHESLVHHLLLGHAVVLELQEEVSLPEDLLIAQGRLLCLLVEALAYISCHFPRQAGAQSNDPLVEFLQKFHVHPGLVVVALRKSPGDKLHQIVISCVVLCQQHKMIVSALAVSPGLLVKPGARGHVDFTAKDRLDPRGLCRLVEVNDAVHDAVVGDGHAVHSQLLHPGNTFLYFIGSVQQTVLCVNVQMCKTHIFTVYPFHSSHPAGGEPGNIVLRKKGRRKKLI